MSMGSQTVEFKFALGADVRDILTGFIGVTISRTEYVSGCVQYGLQGKLQDDGKMGKIEYLDEIRLVPVELEQKPVIETAPDGTQRPGGPQDHPRGMEHPPM